MKIKTSELIGPALDWAVAKCMGHRVAECHGTYIRIYLPDPKQAGYTLAFCPSTDWSQGGPIIQRERIAVEWGKNSCQWLADINDGLFIQCGNTYLQAAMRCYVASKLGDEVEIPEELK
jgi:hypothetical protein